MPRPLRLVLFVMCLVAIVLGILTAATNLIPLRAHDWIALALSIVIALRDAIPVLWARLVTSPDVEPVRVTDAVIKVGVVLFLLAGAAHANPITPGVALPPGPQEIAAEAARPQQAPQQPSVYAADLGPLQVSPTLFAQLAAVPGVINLQQSASTPPAVALNPDIPICPSSPTSQSPPSQLDKITKWLGIGAAVLAAAGVFAEKINSITSGRASATP